METLGLSNLPHYSSGGCIHIVVNNQIGYTTPAQNSRSTVYCSDIAKMINAPVIHVNGDFPEDVSRAMDLVFEYRDKFRKDIILDLITYRRWGHNELDEPAFTQPLMYHNIRGRQSVGKMYEQKLISEGVLSAHEDADKVNQGYYRLLEDRLSEAEGYTPTEKQHLQGNWKNMLHPTDYNVLPLVQTGVDEQNLFEIGKQSVNFPDQITVHPRVDKYHIQARLKKLQAGKDIDWATAESLAFGTLLAEGYNVRISGQDVGRGTFSQRHAVSR
jgi:probable 2-oxoglutarate dehydrogenase E1 component DHKTD1